MRNDHRSLRRLPLSTLWVAATLATLTACSGLALAATPEGTVAALLVQVISPDERSPGSVAGAGFSCNLHTSDSVFEVPDFPEDHPCLKFFDTLEGDITLVASPNGDFVFAGWEQQGFGAPLCTGTDRTLTMPISSFQFTGVGAVPSCKAIFERSPCFVPPDEGDDSTARLAAFEICAEIEDNAECPEGAIEGTDGDDTLQGTEGDDVICGLAGNDVINGLAGSDVIFGGTGSDTLSGDEGDDFIFAGPGQDSVFGGTGEDIVDGGTEPDFINGNEEDDILFGGPGGDEITGAGGNDVVHGQQGADLLVGGPGDDFMDGKGGIDAMFGCGGSDKLRGGVGADRLFGDIDDAAQNPLCAAEPGDPDPGNLAATRDVLVGNAGADKLSGDGGPDRLFGGTGPDDIEGGTGADALFGGPGTNTLDGGSGNDRLVGGPDSDVLTGGTGADQMLGRDGNDGFIADDGESDLLDGGEGCDAAATFFDPGLDTLVSIEQPNDVCEPEP